MTTRKEVDKFIESQKSIQSYPKVKKALKEVLLSIPNKEYKNITKNLILMVLHEGALGQVMHFPSMGSKFKILQLTFPKKIPINALRWVIAHELGHVSQNRNWKNGEKEDLESDADKIAEGWGFLKTRMIKEWIKKHGVRHSTFS